MTKKQEQEALTSLEKLDELTQDILKNSTDGGDANFRQIVFSGLTQTKNPILLEKMKDLLFVDEEEDLKKTIILGIFSHKEMFAPILEYGERFISVPFIDESYDEKESFLLVLDALIELAYKNKLNEFENATTLLMYIYKIACSEKSTSLLADKLLQRFLNSKLGTIKSIQSELVNVIKSEDSELNTAIIAIDILGRGQYDKLLDVLDEILNKISSSSNIAQLLPLLDISTLVLSYYTDKKYIAKIKKLVKLVQALNLSQFDNMQNVTDRIENRIIKLQKTFNSLN